jgi:hypothetical protein
MRSKVIRTLALAIMLSGMSIVLAQQNSQPPGVPDKGGKDSPGWGKGGFAGKLPEQKSPEKSKLEEMLTEALKNNPDIRVAAAKMAEAEAELNRTRLQVTQKVVTLYYAIEAQKKIVEHAEKRDKRGQGLGSAISSEDKDELRQTLALAKSKLAEMEAQMPALLGKSPHSEDRADAVRMAARLALELTGQQPNPNALELDRLGLARVGLAEVVAKPHKTTGPIAERLRKALQTPVKVDYKNITFDAILDDLSKKVPGLPFRRVVSGAPHYSINLRFEKPLPISAILQALEDEFGCSFFVRDYGLVAIPRGQGPHGAMTVEEFLRQKAEDKARPQSSIGKNPPTENVEGLVKSVDSSGLMTLTIGSDAGLTKGHTLELFRLNPSSPSQSKYLGTVRIVEAESGQSVAQPVGRLSSPPQKGDRVASRLLGN